MREKAFIQKEGRDRAKVVKGDHRGGVGGAEVGRGGEMRLDQQARS